MVDIFEEVDEELRRDKYQGLLRKYGPWVLGGALAIIAAAAGYQVWQSWSMARREASSETFFQALRAADEGQFALAGAGLETLAENGAGSYPALALMERGVVALDQGDPEAAAGFFERAARQTSEPILHDLAELKAVWARWDALSFSEIDIRLSSLIGDDAPYRFLAREGIAAAALREGQLDRARENYQFLSFAFEAPDGVRRRAQEALALIEQREAIAAPAGAGIEPVADETEPAQSQTETDETETGEAGHE